MSDSEGQPTAPQARSSVRQWAIRLVKLGVTLVCGWILLASVDSVEWLDLLAVSDGKWVLLSFVLLCVSSPVLAFRWSALVGHYNRLGTMARIYIESWAFSAILPTSLGGDAFRVAEARKFLPLKQAGATVVVERLVGAWASCGLALVAALVNQERAILLAVGGFVAVIAGGSAFLLLFPWTKLDTALSGRWPIVAKATAFGQALRDVLTPRSLVASLFWSAVSQLLVILSVWLCGVAVGAGPGVWFYIGAVPVVWLAGLVPALGGIGPREVALAALLEEVGVAEVQATTIVGLGLAMIVARALLGGVAWIGRQGFEGARTVHHGDRGPEG